MEHRPYALVLVEAQLDEVVGWYSLTQREDVSDAMGYPASHGLLANVATFLHEQICIRMT